jgi:hypothetical protein
MDINNFDITMSLKDGKLAISSPNSTRVTYVNISSTDDILNALKDYIENQL